MSALVRAMGDAGAAGDGGDDTIALQHALDQIEAAGGGTLLLEAPPVEYGIWRTLKIPKVDITIQGRGINTAIVAHSLVANESVLRWKRMHNNVDHGFFLDGIKIVRDTPGRALNFSPTKTDQRWRGTISNVWLRQPNDGSCTLRHLEQALNCRVESAALGVGMSARPGPYLNDGASALAPSAACLRGEYAADKSSLTKWRSRCLQQRRPAQSDSDFLSFPLLDIQNSGFGAGEIRADSEKPNDRLKSTTTAPLGAKPRSSPPYDVDNFEGYPALGRTRSMREVGIGHVFVFNEDCDNIVVSAFFSDGNTTQRTHTDRMEDMSFEIQGTRPLSEDRVTTK